MGLRGFLLLTFAALHLCSGCNKDESRENERATPPADDKPYAPEKIGDPHLENAFKFTKKVWGGAEPHDDAALRSLKELGVKTVLSVDGAKPDVEMAHKYGLKYVHLPFGYDSVPETQAKAIAKALNEFPGPIFVHCHHGKHRSAAALGTACVMNGMLTHAEALIAMKTAGTGENYVGLWGSARNASLLPAKELASLQVHYVEVAPIPPLADAMVEMDACFDHLKLCQNTGWEQPQIHPDIDPAHEALKLRELITEFMRAEEYKARPEPFKAHAAESLAAVESMETQLRDWAKSAETKAPAALDATHARIDKSCKDCHAQYRNVPQR